MQKRKLHILAGILLVGVVVFAYQRLGGPPTEPQPEGPMVTVKCRSCGHKSTISQAMLRAFLKSEAPGPGATIPCRKCGAPAAAIGD